MTKGIQYILLSTFAMSVMNIFAKKLAHLPFVEVVMFRGVFSLFVCYIALRKQNINIWGNNKKLLIARGAFGTVGLIMYFYTLQYMPLATAVTVQYLSPIFSTILSIFMLGETPKPVQFIFFLISFAGILIMKGFDARISTELLLIGVGSAIVSSIAYNIIRKLKDSDHPLVIVFYFPLITIPLVLPYNLYHWQTPIGIDWFYIFMVSSTTHLAQYYMTKAYQAEKLSKVANLNYLGTIYALVFGYFLFNES
ncbi:MAG: EamA family transporter, partial [Pedobacter sp.]